MRGTTSLMALSLMNIRHANSAKVHVVLLCRDVEMANFGHEVKG